MQIRAAVLDEMGRDRPYGESRPLRVEELELEPPGDGELLVRIEAAGLCHSDLSVVDGSRPRPVPMALGHEAVATVVDCGRGGGELRPGDRCALVFVPACGRCRACASGRPALCGDAARANAAGELLGGGRRLRRGGSPVHHHLGVSAFADHAVVDRRSAVPIPADVPVEVAAVLGCAVLTGVGAVVNTARVRAGESLAVLGLGGVGLAAVVGAVVAGAAPVIGVDPVAAKRDLALRLGASHALTPEEARERIPELVPGGVDVAVEAAGSAAVLADAWAVTARGGRTVAVGLPHPAHELRLPAVQLVAEARTLLGSYMGDAVPRRDIPRLVELWRAGRLPVESLLSGTVPLDDVNRALDDLAGGLTVRRLLRPSPE